MELKEFADRFGQFADNFELKVASTIQNHPDVFVDFVHQQLYSGLDGNQEPLRPTYLEDPWFNTPEAGRFQGKPRWYMAWKAKITPPTRAYIGLPGRAMETPNLIIRGDFYDSITAAAIPGGLRISTEGLSFGKDIEEKYGSAIFKISPMAVQEFLYTYLEPEINNYYKSLGL